MPTIKEVLNLPILNKALIKSGEQGVFRQIRWVHTIDTLEVAHFLDGGELLLTSGEIWPEGTEAERELLESLKNIQISGLIFATGYFLTECPQKVVEFGDKYKIPILEIPFHTPFIKITQAVNKIILNKQLQKIELIENVPYETINKLRSSMNMKQTCTILAEFLQCSVFLSDTNKRILTSINITQQYINISELVNDFFAIYNAPSYNYDGNEHISVTSEISALPLKLEENDMWGILWFVGLNKSNKSIIKYTAMLLRTQYLNLKKKQVKENYVKTEILDLLIKKSKVTPQIIESKLKEVEINQYDSFIIGVLFNFQEDIQSKALIENWIKTTYQIAGFPHLYNNRIILFLTTSLTNIEFENRVTKLYEELIELNNNLSIVFGYKKSDLLHVYESYEEMNYLMSFLEYSDTKEKGVFFSENYTKELLLYQGIDKAKISNLRKEIIPNDLLEDHNKDLYNTLKCLTLNNFNREKTIEELFIHRNTLRYRIKKIEDLLGSKLSSSRCQFWLHIYFDLEFF